MIDLPSFYDINTAPTSELHDFLSDMKSDPYYPPVKLYENGEFIGYDTNREATLACNIEQIEKELDRRSHFRPLTEMEQKIWTTITSRYESVVITDIGSMEFEITAYYTDKNGSHGWFDLRLLILDISGKWQDDRIYKLHDSSISDSHYAEKEWHQLSRSSTEARDRMIRTFFECYPFLQFS